MATRRIVLLLSLALATGALTTAPAEAACAMGAPRVSLAGFTVTAGPRPFYLGTEGQVADFVVRFAGGCEHRVAVDWSTSPRTATASDYIDESGTEEQYITNDDVIELTRDITINGPGDGPDAIVESVVVSLSNARIISGGGSVTAFDASAPILIVDKDGTDRVGFEGVPYSQSETFPTAQIPVFWAGPSPGSSPVTYSIAPGPTNPATHGEDFTGGTTGTLSFSTQRWDTIDLTIVNDQLGEGPEDLTITLTGAAVEPASSSMTFTIEDNEENVFPKSRFHHPRHTWRYRKSDYRIREFHVFATDDGGSGVVAAEIALRRNLRKGRCAWLTKSGWKKQDCQNREWLPTKYDEAGNLFFYRMKQLKPSIGTRIKSYTAFSRAIDGAGNHEKDFIKKKNDNTFEIKRSKRKRR
jgi:hypothetical protein